MQDVRISGDRIVLTFDARVGEASAFVLDAPQRIALDLGGVRPGGTRRAPTASSRGSARARKGEARESCSTSNVRRSSPRAASAATAGR